MITEAQVLTELAARFQAVYPAATIEVTESPEYGPVVALQAQELRALAYVVPFPAAQPTTWMLKLRTAHKGYWAGARWPFNWLKVYKGLDSLLFRLSQVQEKDARLAGLRQQHAATLDRLKALAGKGDRVSMQVPLTGEPIFYVTRVCRKLKDAEGLLAKLGRTRATVQFTSTISITGLTAAEAEQCLTS